MKTGMSTKLTIDSKESVKREYNILHKAICKKKMNCQKNILLCRLKTIAIIN